MRSIRFLVLTTVRGVALLVLAGCAQDDVEEARARMREAREGQEVRTEKPGETGSPIPPVPVSGDPGQDAIPLESEGIGSTAELERDLGKLQDESTSRMFDRAFRLTFSSDRGRRDYAMARDILIRLIEREPEFAPAYRTLGYAEFNLDPMNTMGTLGWYSKAVEIDPGYGEAHYAIAFMHAATGDLDRGFEHYRKAMELGVEDERNIGERFYGEYLKGS